MSVRLRQRSGSHRRGRSRRALGRAATAVVGAAVLLSVWSWQSGSPADPGPVPDLPTREERVAQEFVAAVAAGDTGRAESYLLPHARAEWVTGRRSARAWSMRVLPRRCVGLRSAPAGTMVLCPFDVHWLHSERLGLGPFADNLYKVYVRGDRIAFAEEVDASGTNGADELVRRIGAWVRDNHPGHWRLMRHPSPAPVAAERWERMWTRYSREYAAATAVRVG